MQQRLNKRATTAKSQTFKCLIDNCCREFKDRADFASHSTITHALIIKQIVQPRPSYLHLHNFYLKTTQLTKAARSLFDTLIQREARKPYIKRKNLFNLIKTECKLFCCCFFFRIIIIFVFIKGIKNLEI